MMTKPRSEGSAKPVEKLLQKTCKSIAEVEANVEMFTQMTKNAIATNDVRNYVKNQAMIKKYNKGLNKGLIKCSMKSKLNDACADLKHLHDKRNKQRRDVLKAYDEDKSLGRKIIRRCNNIAAKSKRMQRAKNRNKYLRNERKQQLLDLVDEVPKGVAEIVEGVNI